MLVPKWKKSAISVICQEIWGEFGIGRIGIGGGFGEAFDLGKWVVSVRMIVMIMMVFLVKGL